jgi:hypothetical protein
MNIKELEDMIFDKQGIRIVVRLPESTKINPVKIVSKTSGAIELSSFITSEILPLLPPNTTVAVIDGNFVNPPPNTKLSTIRYSYIKALLSKG